MRIPTLLLGEYYGVRLGVLYTLYFGFRGYMSPRAAIDPAAADAIHHKRYLQSLVSFLGHHNRTVGDSLAVPA
jgi:hypothetical protein